MAQGLGISRSGLNKRLHRLTRKSARQFIREIRLNKALEMLKNEVWTASEVAYKIGFSSPSYFNTSFHEFFGYPPGKVRTDIPGESYKEILNRESGKKEKLLSLLQSGKVRIAGLISIPVIIIMIFLIFQKISKKETLDDLWPSEGKISIAVMPFNNMTNDTSLDILQVWIQDEIISSLSNSEELKVRQTESVRKMTENMGITDFALLTPSVAGSISRKLDARIFLYGNIKLTGSVMRLSAQLLDSRNREIIKTFQAEGIIENRNFFPVIDDLSEEVRNYLKISKLANIDFHYRILATTRSPEAYEFYLAGNKAFFNRDFPDAAKWLLKAITIDSNFVGAMTKLSYSYYNQDLYEEAKIWYRKTSGIIGQASVPQIIYFDLLKATLFEPPQEEIRNAQRLLAIDDQLPTMYYRIGVGYNQLQQYERAIPEFEKSLDINKKWGTRPD